MNCYKTRTLFDFFDVADCKSCKYYQEDTSFYIGNNAINIYYLNSCKREDDIDLFLFSKKARLFFKDATLNSDNNLFMIIEDFHISKYMESLEALLELKENIHILVI